MNIFHEALDHYIRQFTTNLLSHCDHCGSQNRGMLEFMRLQLIVCEYNPPKRSAEPSMSLDPKNDSFGLWSITAHNLYAQSHDGVDYVVVVLLQCLDSLVP